MNTNETIKATGQLNIKITAADGTVKHDETVKNLVVTTGLGFIASRMKDATATAMSHMAIGAGSTAAAAGQTALVTESARVALTSTTVTANQVAYVATFPAGTPASLTAITEAGLFNASSAGTMLCRTVFAAVNKDVNDTMSITWTVTIS
ncbi:MAG: hypothetical protein RL745_983 [Actinomycetota bacterium]|jgi:hypothetical protein